MDKFVPMEKRSKKEQRAYHNLQRSGWNGVNPCSSVFPDKKKHNKAARGREKAALRCGL